MNMPQSLFEWLSAIAIGGVGYGIGLTIPVLIYLLPILLVFLAYHLIVHGGLSWLMDRLSPPKDKPRNDGPEPTYLIAPGLAGASIGLGQTYLSGGF